MEKVKVLFVCLGNICRSPLAEALFNHKVKERGLAMYFEADSCATSTYQIGNNPDARTIANARRNGIAINHIARQIEADDLARFNFIMAMDTSNHQNILRLPHTPAQASKVKMMREFDPEGNGDVPDPYHGNESDFQYVFDVLNRTIDNFINYLEQRHLKSYQDL